MIPLERFHGNDVLSSLEVRKIKKLHLLYCFYVLFQFLHLCSMR